MAAGFRSFVQLLLRGLSSSVASSGGTVIPPITNDRVNFRRTINDRIDFSRTASDEHNFTRTVNDKVDFWGPL